MSSPSSLLIVVLLLVAYATLFERVGDLPSDTDDAGRVSICGRVAVLENSDPTGIYEVSDPTGRIFIATQQGIPQDGACVVVVGMLKKSDESRSFVFEKFRLGTF